MYVIKPDKNGGSGGSRTRVFKAIGSNYYKLSRSNAIRVCDRQLHVRFGLSFFKQLETQPDSTSVLLAVDALAP